MTLLHTFFVLISATLSMYNKYKILMSNKKIILRRDLDSHPGHVQVEASHRYMPLCVNVFPRPDV